MQRISIQKILLVLISLGTGWALLFWSGSQTGSYYYYNSEQPILPWWRLWASTWVQVWLYWLGGGAYSLLLGWNIYLVPTLWRTDWRVMADRLFGLIGLTVATILLCQIYRVGNYGNLPGGGLIGQWLMYQLTVPPLILHLGVGVLLWVSLILYTRLNFMLQVQWLVRIASKYLLPALSQAVRRWRLSRPALNIAVKLPVWAQRSQTPVVTTEHEYLDQEADQDQFWQIYLDSMPKVVQSKVVSEAVVAPVSKLKINSFELPDLPKKDCDGGQTNNQLDLEQQSEVLINKLKRFGIGGKITAIKPGPVITLFEFAPAEDAKISRILALENDLALALQTKSIRIIAPVPGRAVVGFEVANLVRENVLLSDVLQDGKFVKFVTGIRHGQLADLPFMVPIALGKDTTGNNLLIDLVKTPHLLIAGSTGSGKSVALNSVLVSLLCANPPSRLRLILVDPKQLEFARYAGMGHLLFPIASDAKKTLVILRWLVREMELRYAKMAAVGVRNLADYNEYIQGQESSELEALPYIVLVIDELADLMMTSGKDVEDLIIRIAQMARAAGIHLIVATQRPSVDVITGLIKVNFPSRIAFRVASKADSRTILDANGADALLGSGDMLFLSSQSSSMMRAHGAYVSDREVQDVVDFVKTYYPANYLNLDALQINTSLDELVSQDGLLRDVLGFLKEHEEVSVSLLQRRFRIGYNRSARIMDLLEDGGYVLPMEGGRLRKVIKDRLE